MASTINPKLELNLKRISKDILNEYLKETHHIQAWDQIHFTMLLASVGFKLKKFIPMEGVPFPKFKNFDINIKGIRNACYTMLFDVEKVKDVHIDVYD